MLSISFSFSDLAAGWSGSPSHSDGFIPELFSTATAGTDGEQGGKCSVKESEAEFGAPPGDPSHPGTFSPELDMLNSVDVALGGELNEIAMVIRNCCSVSWPLI